jgi:hypothetical protein
MIAELCACILLSIPQSGGWGFERAMELVRQGDLGAALAAAETEPHEGRRAQAIVYVRWQAGDLEGALSTAEWALQQQPHNVWLSSRVIDLALILRRPAAAEEGARRLASAAASLAEPGRTEALEHAKAPLDELRRAGEQRDRALGRARAVVLIVAGLSVLALGWLAFAPRRKQPDTAL